MAYVLGRGSGGSGGGGGAPSGPAGGVLGGTYPNPTFATPPPGTELDYAQITSDVTVTGTSSGTATTVVTGASVAYDGSTIVILEFFAAAVDIVAAEQFLVQLFEDGTAISPVWAQIQNPDASNVGRWPLVLRLRRTPSAGSHTYSVRAWRGTTNAIVRAAAASYLPAFLRITKA